MTQAERIAALEAELTRTKEKLAELQDDYDTAQAWITKQREWVEDMSSNREGWAEALGLIYDGTEYVPEPGRFIWEQYAFVVDKHNKLVTKWNRWAGEIQARPRGRPLEASEAQIEEVRKRHKAGVSLRGIAGMTGLSLSTVRSITARKQREQQQRKREFDKHRAREARIRKRMADAAPAQMTRERQEAEELIKAAKGL